MNHVIRIVLLCLFAVNVHAQTAPKRSFRLRLLSPFLMNTNLQLPNANLWQVMTYLMDNPVDNLRVDSPDFHALALGLLNTHPRERELNLVTGTMELALRNQHRVLEAGIWPQAYLSEAALRIALFANPALVLAPLRRGITERGLLRLALHPNRRTIEVTGYRRVGPPIFENVVHSRF